MDSKDSYGMDVTSYDIYYPASSGTKVYLKVRAIWTLDNSGSDLVYSSFSSYKVVSFP